MERRDDSVRPSILLVCLAFLAGAAFLAYKVVTLEPAQRSAQADAQRPLREPPNSPDDTWHHREWRPRPGENAEWPPGPGVEPSPHPAPVPEQQPEQEEDPQLRAMRRSFHIAEGDAGVLLLPFNPTTRYAVLTETEGSLHLSRNARCEVRVLPVSAGEFNCLVRVVCGGQVIYPNREQTAGYAPCDVQNGQPMTATDERATGADGDPAVRLDMRTGTIEVQDFGQGTDTFRARLSFTPSPRD